MRHGNLFVISGPSGTGKGTLVARLLDAMPDAWVSVSATTRAPREGEIDGKSYFFLTRDEFMSRVDGNGFLEWAEFAGNCYGTPRTEVMQQVAHGKQVILEIEVQGAFQVREKEPETKLIFIAPPSMEELENRLRGRATDSEEAILNRLQTAKHEMTLKCDYDVVIVNDDLDRATQELVEYINTLAEEN